MKTVCALVVTYNRKACLERLLPALENQTLPVEKILLVDNASTDGTPERLKALGYLSEYETGRLSGFQKGSVEIRYFRNWENTGGAGGFHLGLWLAAAQNCEFLWAMDDDVLPEPDCLERLLDVISEKTRLVLPCRTDEGYQDRAVVGLNMSNPFRYNIALRKKTLPREKIREASVPIVDMVFEGPLMAASLVEEIGLPKKELFLTFDDTEYALRAGKVTQLRYVKDAILHRQIPPVKDRGRRMGWKDYYGYRNQYWFDRTYGENLPVKYLRPALNHADLCARAVLRGKWSNLRVLRRAYHDGTRGILGKTIAPGKTTF